MNAIKIDQGSFRDPAGKIFYYNDRIFRLLSEEGIKRFINPVGDLFGEANAAPLPKTPMPDKKLVASMPQVNQQTGLTRTQSALLSPSEQVIARRT